MTYDDDAWRAQGIARLLDADDSNKRRFALSRAGALPASGLRSPSTQGGNRHAPANTPGVRHLAFAVEDINAVVAGLRARGAEPVGELEQYDDMYRLCYGRGPEGIIIELAEKIG